MTALPKIQDSKTDEGSNLEIAPRVLVVDDDEATARLVGRWLELTGAECGYAVNGEIALDQMRQAPFDVVCLDLGLPGIDGMSVLRTMRSLYASVPVIILTADDTVQSAVEATRLGAYDYLRKPIDKNKLGTVVRNAFEHSRMTRRLALIEDHQESTVHWGLIGQSDTMRDVFRKIERVSSSEVTVAIHGESGSGKELVARALHRASERRGGPFVALNCAAIPESLQESELFGHEKGAFTGAHTQRIGRFEEAHHGTLFLDEVAELSLTLQAKLLRVLQERSFTRVGGNQLVKSDFRLVTATHKNLSDEVKEGRFREDLYYRIAVFDLRLPPLRERKDDIPLLAHRFLAQMASSQNGDRLSVSPEALDVMTAYSWPGNVRELMNAVQHAAVVAREDTLQPSDLPSRVLEVAVSSSVISLPGVTTGMQPPPPVFPENRRMAKSQEPTLPTLNLKDLERIAIEQALSKHPRNVSAAIRELGLGRTTMYRKLKQYGLRGEDPNSDANNDANNVNNDANNVNNDANNDTTNDANNDTTNDANNDANNDTTNDSSQG
ncbi:MAG: sigma-54-dependent Fis family transcriptional regulator [Deltaproteobacteria bacterium]|nr:sigma-54-dependent Fis family transcriptional regulator [Deltaproteobacteria bacterium]